MILSIITINKNNKTGLQKTMESVFMQDFSDFEYIVIDGASTDGSVEYLKTANYKLQTINYKLVSEPDSGIYNAMNKGIKMANEQNLKVLSPNKAREFGQIWGILSGEVRRGRKKMREILQTMAELPANLDPRDYKHFIQTYNLENASIKEVIVANIINDARKGDFRAIKLFIELMGESSSQSTLIEQGILTKQEVSVKYRASKQEF